MVTQGSTIRFDPEELKRIKRYIKNSSYVSVSEFVRDVVRRRLKELDEQ